ncbi:hypothetical protein V6N13_102106 [Hibiscus sabdariffa]|uniref:Uncharacterized protein n=1 Tax=Hibiscus sabdariffa TaxID=183260 RepID=A0ABR2D318_9ROSI
MVDVFIQTYAEDGRIISGKLQNIKVGIEDLFLKAIAPPDIPKDALPDYYLDLFNVLSNACSSTSNTWREAFTRKGGKGGNN